MEFLFFDFFFGSRQVCKSANENEDNHILELQNEHVSFVDDYGKIKATTRTKEKIVF
jgi:hypothetical protein